MRSRASSVNKEMDDACWQTGSNRGGGGGGGGGKDSRRKLREREKERQLGDKHRQRTSPCSSTSSASHLGVRVKEEGKASRQQTSIFERLGPCFGAELAERRGGDGVKGGMVVEERGRHGRDRKRSSSQDEVERSKRMNLRSSSSASRREERRRLGSRQRSPSAGTPGVIGESLVKDSELEDTFDCMTDTNMSQSPLVILDELPPPVSLPSSCHPTPPPDDVKFLPPPPPSLMDIPLPSPPEKDVPQSASTPPPAMSLTPQPHPAMTLTPPPHPTMSLTPQPHPTMSLAPQPHPTMSLAPQPHPTMSLASQPHPTNPQPLPTMAPTTQPPSGITLITQIPPPPPPASSLPTSPVLVPISFPYVVSQGYTYQLYPQYQGFYPTPVMQSWPYTSSLTTAPVPSGMATACVDRFARSRSGTPVMDEPPDIPAQGLAPPKEGMEEEEERDQKPVVGRDVEISESTSLKVEAPAQPFPEEAQTHLSETHSQTTTEKAESQSTTEETVPLNSETHSQVEVEEQTQSCQQEPLSPQPLPPATEEVVMEEEVVEEEEEEKEEEEKEEEEEGKEQEEEYSPLSFKVSQSHSNLGSSLILFFLLSSSSSSLSPPPPPYSYR